MRNHESKINAAFEFVSEKRPLFLMKECKQVVNQMCAEARSLKRSDLSTANGDDGDGNYLQKTTLLATDKESDENDDVGRYWLDLCHKSKQS